MSQTVAAKSALTGKELDGASFDHSVQDELGQVGVHAHTGAALQLHDVHKAAQALRAHDVQQALV
jgi:hypothetical protein